MKHLLFILFSLASTYMIGQNVESFTVEVSQTAKNIARLSPIDHTVDPIGNIYVLMIHRAPFTDTPLSMLISRYHPQHGLQWTKEYRLENKDLIPKQISWSRMDELMVIGDATPLSEGRTSTYFARISSHGNILLEQTYYSDSPQTPLSVTKMDELATGDLILQVSESDIDHGLMRIDAQGQIQNMVFFPSGWSLADFHITRNNEIYAATYEAEVEEVYQIFQFDYHLSYLKVREFYTPDNSPVLPTRLSENSAAQPVVWLNHNGVWGTYHATFDMHSNGPFSSYTYLTKDTILLSDNRSNTGSVIIGAKDNKDTRFYQHDNAGKISTVLLETSAAIKPGRVMQSYEVSADNRIIALLSNPQDNFVKSFVVTSSKMNFQAGCDLVDLNYDYFIESSILSREVEIDLVGYTFTQSNPETSVSDLAIEWTEKCKTTCSEEPPIPSIDITPQTNWRYNFEATGELDPSVTGIYWSVNGQVVGEGPALEHTFEEPGQNKICLSITTACGTRVVCRDIYIPAARRWNNEQKISAQVWPNPVINQLHINTKNRKIEAVRIYNHLGQKLQLPWQIESDVQIRVQTSTLIRGQYFLEFIDQNGQVETLKFIK